MRSIAESPYNHFSRSIDCHRMTLPILLHKMMNLMTLSTHLSIYAHRYYLISKHKQENYAGSCDKFKTSKNLNNFNICLFHANGTFKNEGMVLTQSQEKLVSTIQICGMDSLLLVWLISKLHHRS